MRTQRWPCACWWMKQSPEWETCSPVCELGQTARKARGLLPKMRGLKLLFIILLFPIWLVETKHFLTQAYKAPHTLRVYFQTSHSCDHFAWANVLSEQLGFLPLRPCFVTITLGAFHTHLLSYFHPLRHQQPHL